MSENLLSMMSSDTIKLSKSDKKIVTIIQRNPKQVIHYSIATLAQMAEVSEPTVNRFCHKLGCDGYPDFKLKLAQQLSSGSHLFVDNMERNDDTYTVMQKIMESIQSSVQLIGKSTSPESINQAASLLLDCNSVSFFGMGASGPVALDAQHKFFRFGMPVIAHTDYINQRMICSMLNEKDVSVFISYTGRTEAIVESARLARDRGAPTIGLTRDGSPLASCCNVVLNAVTAEDTDLFTPMTSRIIHLALIDMLATTVALRMGDQLEENIKAIKTNLRATRRLS
ncbi:transcriptional regulator HexR [Marinibactrum halimedae]|nr:transcriptional regulator HexR [Marinibactrum halimedae]MCD9460943.1 transcriptional regulator HexR [Marinibactrum halimedae]